MLLVFTHCPLHKSIIMGGKLQLSDVHVQHMAAKSLGCFKLFELIVLETLMFIWEEKKIYSKGPTDSY